MISATIAHRGFIYRFSTNFQTCLPALVLIFLIGHYSQAQTVTSEKPVFKFRHLDKELNNNQVSSIFHDQYGYIWIGTFGGLHKYDGVKFELFLSSEEETSLFDNRIETIYEDSKGRLWVGTYEGICLYNREKNNFIRYENTNNTRIPFDPNTNRIRDIIEDQNRVIWIASQREGIFTLDEKTNSFVPYFDSDEENVLGTYNITALHEGAAGKWWVGTLNDGVFLLSIRDGVVARYRHDPNDPSSLSGDYISDIKIDRNDRVWIATNFEGLDRMELVGDQVKFVHYRHNSKMPGTTLGNNDVRQLYIDSNNNLWACNENGGLNLYNRSKDTFWPYFPDPNDPHSISSATTWCIYEDKEGRYWVGSSLEGVDVVDHRLYKFPLYSNFPGKIGSLSHNIVRDLYEEKNGDLWIATDGGGLNYFDRKTKKFRYFTHDPFDSNTISSNAALSICEDDAGRLWIGTWQGGINILDRKSLTFSPFPYQNGNLRSVFQIYKDSDGYIWIGSYDGGLSYFDQTQKKLTNFKNDPSDSKSISHNIVPVIFEDSKGNLWIGTEDGGINFLSKENKLKGIFKRYAHIQNDTTSLASNMVNHVFEDGDGSVWIATSGGLCRYRSETDDFERYTADHGLPVNHIKSITEDDSGYLWIGTSKGISKFDRHSGAFKNYDKNDGLQPGEFSRYSVIKTHSGELAFGGTGGFNLFFPESIKDNPYMPRVYITELRIFNKPVKIGTKKSPLTKHISMVDELVLSYSHSVFTLDYVALNFTNPEKNEYAFRLEGLEKDWNYVGNQQSATYTNLNPGEYIFHVKASNNDGLWNDEGRMLKIIVRPPFWHTGLFRLIVLVVLGAGIYLIFYLRTRRLTRINAQLENMVAERTGRLNSLVDELREKQEQIETTNEELTTTLEDLYKQKDQVEIMNRELENTHDELRTVNKELDKRVQERTSKLVKANQELDRFVYSASHDLSAPLKSIRGLIGITKMENHKKELIDSLEYMEKSVVKLEEVINSLTQFSRNMGHEVTGTEFLFSTVVDDVLDELKYHYQNDPIKVINNFSPEDRLVSDYLRVKIVLSNLVSNAIKYRKENTQDSYVEISFSKEGGVNIIQIRDNGIGIDPTVQDKVFSMFFRGTDQSKGSGLGLYIVKETIDKLRGEICLESVSRQYTQFTVRLPDM